MNDNDARQRKFIAQARAIGRAHRPASVSVVRDTVTCACGFESGNSDGLEEHRATLIVAAIETACQAEFALTRDTLRARTEALHRVTTELDTHRAALRDIVAVLGPDRVCECGVGTEGDCGLRDEAADALRTAKKALDE